MAMSCMVVGQLASHCGIVRAMCMCKVGIIYFCFLVFECSHFCYGICYLDRGDT